MSGALAPASVHGGHPLMPESDVVRALCVVLTGWDLTRGRAGAGEVDRGCGRGDSPLTATCYSGKKAGCSGCLRCIMPPWSR
jgi:hypothetical protein